jgi:hypothetical protein
LGESRHGHAEGGDRSQSENHGLHRGFSLSRATSPVTRTLAQRLRLWCGLREFHVYKQTFSSA